MKDGESITWDCWNRSAVPPRPATLHMTIPIIQGKRRRARRMRRRSASGAGADLISARFSLNKMEVSKL
jgi:hypothetical protein